MKLSALQLVTAAVLLLLTTAFLRVIYIVTTVSRQRRDVSSSSFTTSKKGAFKTGPSHMIIVLGSGGHTAEMMSLLRDLDPRRYFHRTYIVSSGDAFSASKAGEIERGVQGKCRSRFKSEAESKSEIKDGNEDEKGDEIEGESQGEDENENEKVTKEGEIDEVTGVWEVKVVPRARKIHQSILTAPATAAWCWVCCLWVLWTCSGTSSILPKEKEKGRMRRRRFPDVIVTNGPATAVMVILAATVLRFFGLAPLESLKSVYVESWARVRSLSLSGRILLGLGVCDVFLVQWEGLARRINGEGEGRRKRVDWVGFLVA